MNEERYILFDQCLQGELTVDEKNNFEKQLFEDDAFSSEFETFKEMHFQLENKFGQQQEREIFMAKLDQISDKYFKKEKTKVASFRPWYFVAAASVIILCGLFFFDDNNNPSFDDYNHPESAYFTERGVSEETLKKAEETFNGKRYEQAVPLFESILKENNSPEIKYFYGVSLLQIDKYVKAEEIFKELEEGNSIYKEKAKWNMALSKLKRGDYEASKAILQTISQDYEDYDEVEKLLEELN